MSNSNNNKAMHITLWIFQIILGGMFIMAGVMKSTGSIAELAAKMTWVNDFSAPMVRFVGISELLGGIGLILPSLLRIQPKLSIWAAIALAVVMLLAIIYHIVKNEAQLMAPSVIMGILAVFIAWGRSKKAIIVAK